MNNGWLQFLIPKVHVQVDSLAELSQIKAEKGRIYRLKRVEDGYVITIRRDSVNQGSIVGRQSIYRSLTRFVLPVAFVWTMLLVAIQFVTLDYEIRGNLVHEDVEMVHELIDAYFMRMGTFAFFHGSEEALIETVATAFHDYIWVDVQVVGSLLVINIFDTQVTEKAEAGPAIDTLYARASGVVTKVDAKGCRVLVEIDQVVHQGDPLITCYTPTGFGTEVAPIEGAAAGSVYAHVWYEVAITFPREYGVRMVTGSSRSHLFLNVGAHRLKVWGAEVPYEVFDTRNQVFNPLELFKVAPITLERVHYYEKSDIILRNEVEMIRKRADDLVKAQLSDLMLEAFELVDLHFLSLEEQEGMVKMIYHATVNEDIAN